MKSSSSRTSLRLAVALATLLLAAPSHAQQQQPTAATESAPPAPSVAAPQPIPAPGDAGTATDNAGKSLKTVASSLHELSPWSMFLSADIIVKAVMIGLAFGRIGCLLNGCCYGAACEANFAGAVTYPYHSNAYVDQYYRGEIQPPPELTALEPKNCRQRSPHLDM